MQYTWTVKLRIPDGQDQVSSSPQQHVPRLELSAAVLRVEIGEFVAEHLNIPTEACYFVNKDSRVVLGYIYNENRRFHVTVLTEYGETPY